MAPLDQTTFRKALDIAMGRAGVRSMVELSRRAEVSRNTIYGWGISAPKYAELSKVAGVLDVPTAYLIEALEGRLWPDPRTREVIPNAASVEAEVERLVRLTLERIAAEGRTPRGRGTAPSR
jgi:hypothetical protein